jgi:hypothetical protein
MDTILRFQMQCALDRRARLKRRFKVALPERRYVGQPGIDRVERLRDLGTMITVPHSTHNCRECEGVDDLDDVEKDEKDREKVEKSVATRRVTTTSGYSVVAAAATMAAMTLPANAASETRGHWHVRRHMLRMKDELRERGQAIHKYFKDYPQSHKQAPVHKVHKHQRNHYDDKLRSLKQTYHTLQQNFKNPEAPVYSIGISGGPAAREHLAGQIRSANPSPLGWWVAGLAAIAAIAALGRNIVLKLPFFADWIARSRRLSGAGGRWVRDRSLGGKLVFIPDSEPVTQSFTPESSQRPLWSDADWGLGEKPNTESTGRDITSDTTDSKQHRVTPEWWAPPAPLRGVIASRKADLASQARATLKVLEDAKLLRGEDYSLDGLVRLRQLCHEGGGITVRPHTESGRDAMLRAAVKYSILQASQGRIGLDLAGYEPGRFISGLATDLGVPEARAITITHAEVAATCRSALIDAEAAYRSGKAQELVQALRRMVSTLQAFALPPHSPEAELVGRSIQSQTTLEFRKAIFLAAGAVDVHQGPILAEMLGFEPSLVVPQLELEIRKNKQSESREV